MKLLLLLLLLFPTTKTPVIHYRQLSWEDYRAPVPPNATNDAITCTNISIGLDTAYAVFYPDRSWMRSADSALLRHEQVHFAITRDYAKIVDSYLKCPFDDCREKVGKIIEAWRNTERQYDLDTNHGTDTLAQKQWEQKINTN